MPNGENNTSSLNMQPQSTQAQMENPQTNQEVYQGSFASILMNNVGVYVVVDFLIGTSNMTQREGILYTAGINFITLYNPRDESYTVCDLYSVKFVTFYNATTVPQCRRPVRMTQQSMPAPNMAQGTNPNVGAPSGAIANPNMTQGGMDRTGVNRRTY